MGKWTVTGGPPAAQINEVTGVATFPKNTGTTDITYTIRYTADNGKMATTTYTINAGEECQPVTSCTYTIITDAVGANYVLHSLTSVGVYASGTFDRTTYDSSIGKYKVTVTLDNAPALYAALSLTGVEFDNNDAEVPCNGSVEILKANNCIEGKNYISTFNMVNNDNPELTGVTLYIGVRPTQICTIKNVFCEQDYNYGLSTIVDFGPNGDANRVQITNAGTDGEQHIFNPTEDNYEIEHMTSNVNIDSNWENSSINFPNLNMSVSWNGGNNSTSFNLSTSNVGQNYVEQIYSSTKLFVMQPLRIGVKFNAFVDRFTNNAHTSIEITLYNFRYLNM